MSLLTPSSSSYMYTASQVCECPITLSTISTNATSLSITMTTLIVNKNDHFFLHRLLTGCELPIQPAPRFRSAFRSVVFCHARSTRFSTRSAHMLCMRASRRKQCKTQLNRLMKTIAQQIGKKDDVVKMSIQLIQSVRRNIITQMRNNTK